MGLKESILGIECHAVHSRQRRASSNRAGVQSLAIANGEGHSRWQETEPAFIFRATNLAVGVCGGPRCYHQATEDS
jgi:hypothetical protein